MAIAAPGSIPIAVTIESASPPESRLVMATIGACILEELPDLMIGDRAYDSDPLDEKLREVYGVELVAPHRDGRKRPPTQDGRVLRRYKRRWGVERLFAWLQNYRRVLVRHEYYALNFLGFVELACVLILLRQF